jgi:NADH:ubiquinone reductase (H+-translocating)
MGRLLKGGLALGGTFLALGALRRALNPQPRYAPWEKPPYGDFENKVLDYSEDRWFFLRDPDPAG